MDPAVRSILVVDDEAPLRKMIRRVVVDVFGASGLDIGEARTGAECIAMIRERAWSLVVLDLRMPDTHGFEVLEAIKRARADVPVVILSALPADQYAASARRSGASAYVEKDRFLEDLVPLLVPLLAAPEPQP